MKYTLLFTVPKRVSVFQYPDFLDVGLKAILRKKLLENIQDAICEYLAAVAE